MGTELQEIFSARLLPFRRNRRTWKAVSAHAQYSICRHVIIFYVISWGQLCAAQDVNLRRCQVSNYFIRNTAWQIIHLLIVIYKVLVIIFDCEKIKMLSLHICPNNVSWLTANVL